MRSGKDIFGLAFIVVLSVTAGAAGAGPLDPAIGNTIVSTHPDGRKARLWLGRDGAYEAEGRAGQKSGGVWSLKGDRLCLRQRHPIAIPFSYCKPIPSVTVGQSWRDKAVNGEQVTNEIVPGAAGKPGAG